MRVMIEFDLPDGQAVPTVDDIKRLTDPNWISDWWHIDDVKGVDGAEDLSDEDCREVLRRAKRNLDANIGLNWETFEYLVDAVKDEREAA